MSITQIEALCQARSEAWQAGDPDHVVADLTTKIDTLYAERRRTRVELVHGPADVIIKRARIESELERLMSE